MRILDTNFKHEVFQLVAFLLIAQVIFQNVEDVLMQFLIMGYLVGFGVSNQRQGAMNAKRAILREVANGKAKD